MLDTIKNIGGKGYGLEILKEFKMRVPNFFIVTAAMINAEFNLSNNSNLKNLLLNKYNIRHNYEKDIDNLNFSLNFTKTIFKEIKKINGSLYAVRSSGIEEDGKVKSFAGQYKTILGVTKKNIIFAIKEVIKASFSKNIINYKTQKKWSPIAIIIQKQINSDKAGVCFSTSPFSPKHILIEIASGMGENLVSGIVSPKKIIINKINPYYTNDKKILELANISQKIEVKLGYAVDIEFAIKNNKLFLLQVRPITSPQQNKIIFPSNKYELYVYRPFQFLTHSIQALASQKNTQIKTMGFFLPIKNAILINGYEYYDEETNSVQLDFWKKYDENNFFDRYIKKIYKLISKTSKITEKIKNYDNKNINFNKTKKLFHLWINNYIKSYVPLMMRPDDYLENKIKEIFKKQAKDIFYTLSFSDSNTISTQQQIDFYKLILDPSDKNIQIHLNKYAWLKDPLSPNMDFLTKNELINKIESYNDDPNVILNSMLKRKKENINNYLDIKKHVDSADFKYVDYLKEFVYLRTLSSEVSDRLFYYGKSIILKNFAQYFKMPIENFTKSHYKNLINCINTESLTNLSPIDNYCFVWNDGNISYYYGDINDDLIKKLQETNKDNCHNNKIYGTAACFGTVTSKAKIVSNKKDIINLQDGDIIVTSMLTPDLITSSTKNINKIGGIITDEGGITCHAAIISREFNIPCLVGTKCATKLIKNNNKIKLDTENGYVEIL